MKTPIFNDQDVPYFCWDRKLTAGEIRSQLRTAVGLDWVRLASWLMREAATADVWAFMTPSEVKAHFHELAPFLHRKRGFWTYLIGTWHELGRV
jgi:hypothetical protein